ncbi:hypothetical protein NEDG_01760 [Nematocida displodere]|uniref:AB hydrolase-1 domain-containing protein n=1 Tax=Nematocida displodere TaxID=1805483 RepID=A0A177EE05_9MICR|nr:hypothetical protein NEDG_01760 [Nematocida displodere]
MINLQSESELSCPSSDEHDQVMLPVIQVDRAQDMKYGSSIVAYLVREIFCAAPLSKLSPPHQMNPFREHIQVEEVSLKTKSGERLGAWVVVCKEKVPDLWVLALHGNSTNRYTFSQRYDIEKMIEKNVGVLIVDYRGFADSEGVPNKQAFLEDVAACFKYFRRRGIDTVGVLAYSLGTAIALEYLAVYYHREAGPGLSLKISKLVLVSPFASTTALLQEYQVWRIMQKFLPKSNEHAMRGLGYDSITNIKKIAIPTLIVHGSSDWIIPWQHGEQLSKAAGAVFVKVENASHSSVFKDPATWGLITSFFRE